ncbi:hypothetical protein ACLB2K_007388 [Fragaria x ananassa]
MNLSGGGVLPQNVASLHLVDLPGPYVLQVDEIVNISNTLKIRYQKAWAGHKRCLKLSMTDGVQPVFGMEYRPIQALDALAPAGLKAMKGGEVWQNVTKTLSKDSVTSRDSVSSRDPHLQVAWDSTVPGEGELEMNDNAFRIRSLSV